MKGIIPQEIIHTQSMCDTYFPSVVLQVVLYLNRLNPVLWTGIVMKTPSPFSRERRGFRDPGIPLPLGSVDSLYLPFFRPSGLGSGIHKKSP